MDIMTKEELALMGMTQKEWDDSFNEEREYIIKWAESVNKSEL